MMAPRVVWTPLFVFIGFCVWIEPFACLRAHASPSARKTLAPSPLFFRYRSRHLFGLLLFPPRKPCFSLSAPRGFVLCARAWRICFFWTAPSLTLLMCF